MSSSYPEEKPFTQANARVAATATMLFLVTLAIFMPTIWHDFVIYDDPDYVTENSQVLSGITIEGIRWALTSGFESNWFPLTRISHMVDVQLFGTNPGGHHLVSVLIHAASTVLLFYFLHRTTQKTWLSLATAFLFGLHPLRVESVAWVSERKDVLCTFFGILVLNAYAQYAREPSHRRYLATLFLFILGLMSKPMLVSLPLLLLLLDWWPLARWESAGANDAYQKATAGRLLIEKIPFFVLSLCSSLITYFVQKSAGSVTQTYVLFARIERACISYLVYLQKTIWPAKLAVIYPFFKYPPTGIAVVAAALTLLAITILVIRFRRQAPYLMTGWLWYLITLMPVIGIIQVGQHSVADRYTYLPHIGLFILTVWSVSTLANQWKHGKVASGLVLIFVVAVMGILTSMQLKHWENSFTLFTHALNVTENNWVAHNNLGLVLVEQGRTDDAIMHFQAAIAAKPSHVPAYQNMGYAFRSKGDFGAALHAFRTAAMLEAANPKSHIGLGLLYTEMGSRENALEELRILQRLNPVYADTLSRAITERFVSKQ